MEYDEIVVKESPGLCRCCLSEGCYKDLGTEYAWMNETEVYADMLLECFDISITQHNEGPNGPNRLICEVCITRLRDACNFKKQVLESEKRFIDLVGRGEFRPKVLIYQTQMKAEDNIEEAPVEDVEYLDDEIDFGDDEPAKHDETPNVTDDVTVDALPAKGKRGRPRKSADVKTPKKMKIADEKPKTSKAVAKDKLAFEGQLLRKYEVTKLLATVLDNSTILPFRWFNNKFTCFFCCVDFDQASILKKHMSEEHLDAKITRNLRVKLNSWKVYLDISNIICKLCNQHITTFENYLDHIIEVHSININKALGANVPIFDLEDEVRCLFCVQSFGVFGKLVNHMKTVHCRSNHICEVCGTGFMTQRSVENHLRNKHHAVQVECNECSKLFSNQRTLKCHIDKAHKYQIFQCNKCPQTFPTNYMKDKHLTKVHSDRSQHFPCDVCSKVFTRSYNLLLHKSRVHLKIKNVACETCGFKVFNNNMLRKHQLKHTGVRSYECDVCNKKFIWKHNLERHMIIHTNDRRRYICKECDKAFVQTSSLKTHIIIHHQKKDSAS